LQGGVTAPEIALRNTMKLLLTNVRAYSLDERDTIYDAIAIGDGLIAALGSAAALRSEYAGFREIDLEGAEVYPGFVDAHAHIYGMGERLTKPRLEGLDSKEKIYQKLTPPPTKEEGAGGWSLGNGWIVSRGWDHTLLPNAEFPTRDDLDRNVSDKQPIALTRVDGHALWCNSRALEAAGIDRATADPLGGAILHDDAGEPTGILIDEAMKLVESKIPQPTKDDLVRTLRTGLEHFAKMGHVAVHEMGVNRDLWEAYVTLYTEHGDELPRAYVFLDMTKETGKELFLNWCREPSPQPLSLQERGLHFAGIKLYLDGALGSRGANLFEDYSDDPGNRGLALMEDKEVLELMQFASDHGLQIAVHAIGDKANARALDLFSQLHRSLTEDRSSAETRNPTLRIEHAQIVRKEDLDRFKKMNVYALVQPAFFQSDRRWAGERLGAERMRTAYRWKSFLDAGVSFVASSDAPIEEPNPLEAIELLTTRDGVPDGEAISHNAAIRAYARTGYELTEDRFTAGILAPTMKANLTIVKEGRVIATIREGRMIYSEHPLL
jgi:predicted amidohydrolase YtcJ